MTAMDDLHKLATTRLAVAFLGEKSQHTWWKSSFLCPLGFRVAERLTPRTSRSACFESATQSAMRVHDAAIGKGGVVHLFRFPPEEEQTIHAITVEWDNSALLGICDSADAAVKFLSTLAAPKIKIQPGPLHIGGVDDWRSATSLAKLAAVYLTAFQSESPSFPYFA
jgi:hypothetical protein